MIEIPNVENHGPIKSHSEQKKESIHDKDELFSSMLDQLLREERIVPKAKNNKQENKPEKKNGLEKDHRIILSEGKQKPKNKLSLVKNNKMILKNPTEAHHLPIF